MITNESGQEIYLTPEEYLWLRQHGDRNARHVFMAEDGHKYVFMVNGRGEMERVYLPPVGIKMLFKKRPRRKKRGKSARAEGGML